MTIPDIGFPVVAIPSFQAAVDRPCGDATGMLSFSYNAILSNRASCVQQCVNRHFSTDLFKNITCMFMFYRVQRNNTLLLKFFQRSPKWWMGYWTPNLYWQWQIIQKQRKIHPVSWVTASSKTHTHTHAHAHAHTQTFQQKKIQSDLPDPLSKNKANNKKQNKKQKQTNQPNQNKEQRQTPTNNRQQ